MMHTWVASSSASSMCWVLMMIDRVFLTYLIKSHTYLRLSTSNPDVGSSKIITLDLPMKDMAKLSFRFIPPDKSRDSLC